MSIEFRFRDFFHPVGILRLRRILERTQWMAPDDLEAYQSRLLRQLIHHAYDRVPYYRQVLDKSGVSPGAIRSRTDLKRLPQLSRQTIRDRFDDLTAKDADKHYAVMTRTSGTSGTPIRFYLDRQANILEFCYYWRHWSWAGYRLGDRTADLGAHYFLSRAPLHDRPFHIQRHTRRLMLNSSHINRENIRQVADAFRRFRPRFLKGLASALYFLALCLKDSGINDLHLKGVFSTGEMLLNSYRSVIESLFHCKVMDSYGHMERTVAICQCPEGGYHVNSDYGVMEFNPNSAETDTENLTGEIIGTSLYNVAMPLIRYPIGDLVEIYPTPRSCPCGRTLPLIRKIHGRKEDVIVTPDGRHITSIFIIPQWFEGIRFIQFIQEKLDILKVQIVPDTQWDDSGSERLKAVLRRMTGNEMEIHIETIPMDAVIRDTSGKCRIVISELRFLETQ